MKWYGRKRVKKLRDIDCRKIIVIDTETTGLMPQRDEILQITVLDGYGSSLFDSYIKPMHHKSWRSAQKINGITPDMVAEAPFFKDVRADIQKIFDKASLIVGYNVNFDINFIEAAGIIVSGKVFDVMREFASFRKDVDRTVYHTCKLTECAEYYSYSFSAHSSKEDAEATLYCFNKLIEDTRFSVFEKSNSEFATNHRVTKTKYTIKLPTRKRRRILYGFGCIIIGELLFYFLQSKFLLDIEDYIVLVEKVLVDFSVEHLALFLVSLGCCVLIIGIVKYIISMPRRVMSRIRRLINKLS